MLHCSQTTANTSLPLCPGNQFVARFKPLSQAMTTGGCGLSCQALTAGLARKVAECNSEPILEDVCAFAYPCGKYQ